MGQNRPQKWTQRQKSTQKWISTLKKQEIIDKFVDLCVMIYYQFFVAKRKIKKK